VFALGRIVASRVFPWMARQSGFAMGGIFSNNLLLGIPFAKVTLGNDALPVVSLVLVFNSLILWMLVTVSVEWARTRHVSIAGFAKTARNVATNPIVAGILLGTTWGFIGLPLPDIAGHTLDLIGQAAVPLSLIALGMGLAEYGIREGLRESAAISAIKLVAQPLVVYGLAWLLARPPLETRAIGMLASLPVGANVYLMAREFGVLGFVAASLVLSTVLASVTAPVVLILMSSG
jgi:predicted permease